MKKFIFLLIITSIISFLFQGKRGLWEPDEGRYVECSREMLITHDYLIPKLNLEPHLSKPPVTYWLISFCLKTFGKNEFSARLPNSITFFLTVILIFLITLNKFNYHTAIKSAFIYSTSIFPFIGLNIVTTDTILTFFIWLYIFLYFRKNYYLMSFAAGLAFLTKGPPSLLPMFGIFIYNLANKQINLKLKKFFICLSIFFITGLSWYLIVIYKDSSIFSYFINNEIIGRLKGIHHRNSGTFDWLMYIPILLFGLSPWVFLVKKENLIKNFKELKIFYFIILIPLIIFCFAKSRLPLYILPLMPAVAIIIGRAINKINYNLVLYSTIFLIILRLIAVWIPYSKNDKQIFFDLKKYIKAKEFNLSFVTTRKWHGLNFYFNKIPEYLSLNKDKKLNRFAKKTVEEKLNEIKNSKLKNYILISDRKKILEFEKIINSKKINFKKYIAKRFTIFEIN